MWTRTYVALAVAVVAGFVAVGGAAAESSLRFALEAKLQNLTWSEMHWVQGRAKAHLLRTKDQIGHAPQRLP